MSGGERIKKEIKRIRWFFDHEKEEAWLNEMAGAGWNLTRMYARRYAFERGTPGEYRYGMLLLDAAPMLSRGAREQLGFVQGGGAQYVTRCLRWAYFRRRADEGVFRLYTDRSSQAANYRKAALTAGLLGVGNAALAAGSAARGTADTLTLLGAAVSLPFLWMMFVYISKIRRVKRESGLYE
ncbi:DUF2812 domain-containing protein [Saccharibacillus sp. CPCC 101409]|uniref:DUF2812 domain-containing protein n=1 Tax=Saccharibacillus sp. CPCC 101409 TaxID=3058041 RepID=UPI002672D7DE|nr:DUF2812 domain-containing protein [Saccharibacillus sp. CPCC 101409]MDO3409984.1 DUF2812 domain-containing protein [Saccharibacillus sp. CPCC 101409]